MPPTVEQVVTKALADREKFKLECLVIESQIQKHNNKSVPLTRYTCQLAVAKAIKLSDQLSDIQTNLMYYCDEEQKNKYNQEYISLSDRITNILKMLNIISTDLGPSATPSTSIDQKGFGLTQPPRLPKLDLPQFSGKSIDWIGFRDMFKSTIHTSTSLTDAQKLTYLKSLLLVMLPY